MPLKLGEAVGYFTQGLKKKNMFERPVIMAGIITAILLLIVWWNIYTKTDLKDSEQSYFKILLKIGAWSFIANLFLIYIHSSAIKGLFDNQYNSARKEDVVLRNTRPGEGIMPALETPAPAALPAMDEETNQEPLAAKKKALTININA